MNKEILKKTGIYAGIVAALLALSYAFAPQVLSGRIVNQSDASGWKGMAQEAQQWNADHPDDQTQWTDSMFGGMPTTSIIAPTKGDLTQKIYNIFLGIPRPVSYLFIVLLGSFLLFLALGTSPLVAFIGAVAVGFCSYNFQIIQVGHNTKMQAIAFLPWVLAAVIFTYKSSLREGKFLLRTALGAGLFALALSFQIKANHPQISYYLALMILIYVVAVFVSLLLEKNREKIVRFFVASGLLLILGLVGIGTNATKLIPTWEYTKYTTRGGNSDGTQKGLDMDYATAWSYGWEELPNLMIPNFNGGSSAGAVDPKKSETIKLLRRAGQSNLKEVAKALPLYWGPQPFTAGPMYMGAITVFLFVLGLCLIRTKEKWWMLVATIVAIFLGLGSNFQWFTTLFYMYAPMYSKFRTVSMALVVLQYTLPMLGFLALDRIVRDAGFAEEFRKKGWIAFALTGGVSLVFALLPDLAGGFVSASDAGQPDVLLDALAADRRALLVSDAWMAFGYIAAAFVILWWGVRYERKMVAAALVGVLVVVNMFAVGKRYLNDDHFVSKRSFSSQFDLRPVDMEILEDTDPSYRVLDLSTNVFNDSHPSYWHKSIGGYSPAKLRIYQDYIEKHLNSDINAVYKSFEGVSTVQEAEAALPYLESLSKLNCRYIILGGDNPPLRYRHAKGPAWFEDGKGEIAMTQYAPNRLEYAFSSSEGGKAVFSEVYYPAGWRAFLGDGTELEIALSDELLRSVDLPAGEGTVTMVFAPASYKRGAAMSLVCSIIILLTVLAAAGVAIYKRWK